MKNTLKVEGESIDIYTPEALTEEQKRELEIRIAKLRKMAHTQEIEWATYDSGPETSLTNAQLERLSRVISCEHCATPLKTTEERIMGLCATHLDIVKRELPE